MRAYRRKLPHREIEREAVFLTWRLRGSLPNGRHFTHQALSTGQVFHLYDQLLDTYQHSPRHLAKAELAQIVEEALLAGNGGPFQLHSWCIMPNHVHVLVTPLVPIAGILQSWKGATARALNLLLGRRGALWQDETFDRQVRDAAGFERIAHYIEWNPVAAGLVTKPEQYRWSSAWQRRGVGLQPADRF